MCESTSTFTYVGINHFQNQCDSSSLLCCDSACKYEQYIVFCYSKLFVHVRSCWGHHWSSFWVCYRLLVWVNLCSAAVSVNLEVLFSFASQISLFIFVLFDFLFYYVSAPLVSCLSQSCLRVVLCLSGHAPVSVWSLCVLFWWLSTFPVLSS